ncbi:MAG TPA: hypothetical protein VGQ46_01700 [Thermoanaerobaculia bacterium]|jgi:hypothetical protein|nr:hypothetical protein [Thermoanaerobaculia bacterium]
MKRRLAAVMVCVFAFLSAGAEARVRAVRLPLQVEAGFGFTLTIDPRVTSRPPELTSITFSVSGPSGITVVPIQPVSFAPLFGPVSFRINTDVAMTPGRVTLIATGTPAGAPAFIVAPETFVVDVTPAQFNSPSVTPSSLNFVAGDSASFTARTRVLPGYPSTIVVTPQVPPGITVTPQQAVLTGATAANGAAFTVTSAVPGVATIPVEFRSSTGQQQTVPLTVTVGAAPSLDFSMTVSPPVLTVSAGETRQFTVTITPLGPLSPAANNDVVVTVGSVNGVTVTPSQFTVTAPATRSLTVTVSPQSNGIVPITITGVGSANRHTGRLDVGIVPSVTSIVPSSVVAPSTSQTVRLAGTNFAQGGTVISRSPGVVVERTIVYSATLAEAVIRVQPGAPIGALRLDFRNPDGGVSARGATLFVYPQEAIGAPLGVSTAAIVFPVEGTIVSTGQNVYPRALLATSGTGTVTGHWAIDGIPFDHFTLPTSAGEPLKVRTQVPIPPSPIGRHDLSLVIESPQMMQAPSIAIEWSAVSLPPISIYEPLDRAIIEGTPRIRWSLVPGASSYEIELKQMAADHRDAIPRRVHTTDSEWLGKDLAAGTYSIRVRPIYPIDVRGEPTPWVTAVVLPGKASLRIDSAAERRIAWSGGSPGMLYRVEFLAGAARCFDALTFAANYRLPASIPWRGCDGVRIRAVAPSGAVIGVSDIQRLTPSFENGVTLARDVPAAEIVERFPTPRTAGARVAAVGARWRGGSADDVSLLVDGVDVTSVSVRERQSIAYDTLIPLRGGTHVASFASPGRTDEWTFDVIEDPPPTPPAAEKKGAQYVLEPNGSVIWSRAATKKEMTEEHLAISSEGERGDAVAATGTKGKGDLAWVDTSDPNRVIQESRSIRLDERIGTDTFGLASLGYLTPAFTDGTEYLQSGVARTGVALSGGSKYGTLSYYQPFDPTVHGVVSAAPENLKIRSFALASPEGRRYVVRAIGLQVDEPANVLLATPGSATRTYGILAGYALGPAAALIVEAARGTTDSPSGNVRGTAFRIGLTGKIDGADYTLNLREVTPFFVNPANRGLTTSSIADRQGGDFNITRAFGKSTLAFAAARQEQGRSSESTLPHASNSSAGVNFSTLLKPWLALTSSVSAAHDSADVASGSTLPRTDRLLTCSSATLSETFEKLGLSQKLDWSRVDNRVDPSANTEITGLTVTGAGALGRVNLNSAANYTRTRATPLLGTSTDWFVQLSPTISMQTVKVTPGILIGGKSNDVIHLNSRTENYSTIMQWSPPWFASLLTGELYGATTRSSDGTTVMKHTTTRQARASVTVHLRKSRDLPMFATAP